jgi:undecaprenyl-diphosphatase
LQRPRHPVESRLIRSPGIVTPMTTDPSPTPVGSDARTTTAEPTHDATAGRVDATAVAWALLAVIGLAGFVVMTVMTLNHVVWPFDQPLLAQARQWVGDGTIWRVISESANIPLIVIGVGLVVVLFVKGHRREALVAALVLIAVTAGSEAVKQLVARPRPEGTDPNIPGVVYSYPSGHVLEALTIFGIIVIQLARANAPQLLVALLAIAVVVDALLVGLSRVVLNAHYPSDALASLLAGVGVLGLYGLLTHREATSPDTARAAQPAVRSSPTAT